MVIAPREIEHSQTKRIERARRRDTRQMLKQIRLDSIRCRVLIPPAREILL